MNDYNFKAFEKVLVRAEGYDKWMASFYSHYDKEENVHMLTNGAICIDCLPYEGNEALLGTTDAPQPKRWRAERSCEYYYINNFGDVLAEVERHLSVDDSYYNAGNYFQTRAEALAVADRFKAILKGE